MKNTIFFLLFIGVLSCSTSKPEIESIVEGTFGYDVHELSKYHSDLIVLSEGNGSIAVVPAYQGRVMTSTAKGVDGKSFGWINHPLIQSQKFAEHINVFGGEDRFWIGPEGGQYAVFFKPGSEFSFENWFTPAPIDTEPFEVVSKTTSSVTFSKGLELTNHTGTVFTLAVDRKIEMVNQKEFTRSFSVDILNDLNYVGFKSSNSLKNTGETAWNRDTGMLSIWILGMFNPSPNTVVFAPYINDSTVSPLITDDYFGKVPEDRLKTMDKVILFKGDGQLRSKIGLSYEIAKDIAGSYSPEDSLLTIIRYSKPSEKRDYVNSLWKYQDDPFNGDVFNSYNDGPLEDGSQLGPFYELESSSPAAALHPGESLLHIHETYHFQGNPNDLNQLTQDLFDVELNKISFN